MNFKKERLLEGDFSKYNVDSNKSNRRDINNLEQYNKLVDRRSPKKFQGQYDVRSRNDELNRSNDAKDNNEMYYCEPEGRNEFSNITEGRQQQYQRSPDAHKKKSVIRSAKMDLNQKSFAGKNQSIDEMTINLPVTKNIQKLEASPKTINLGQQDGDYDYNTRTRDKRSPNRLQENYDQRMESTYKMTNLNNSGFIKDTHNPHLNVSPNAGMNKFQKEIEDEEKRKEKRERYENMKKIQNYVYYNNEDEVITEMPDNEEIANIYKNYDKDLLKFSETKVYDERSRKKNTGYNHHKKEGKLINYSIETLKPIYNENTKTRQTSKMNKLSNIILSRSLEPQNRSKEPEYSEETRTLRDIQNNQRNSHKFFKQKKFIRITMAMLSSKGHNCEDRIFTRKMRYETGGVVDLAQSTHKPKRNEIKKIQNNRSPVKKVKPNISIKERQAAVKIVQKWWRDILSKFKGLNKKIIRLQSFWRGYWVRTYIYEIIVLTVLAQLFIDKLLPPINSLDNRLSQGCFDILKDNFAEMYHKKKRFEKILQIQRNIKVFLSKLKVRNLRFEEYLERLKLRIKFGILKEIYDYSQSVDRKTLKAVKFVDHIGNILKKKLLHSLMFSIFDFPVKILQFRLKTYLVRKKLLENYFFSMRRIFIKWFQITRPNKMTDKTMSLSTALIIKVIKKHIFNSVSFALKNLLNKNFKNKFIRRLLWRQTDTYNSIILKEYFKRWVDLKRASDINEFKGVIMNTFLFRTQKKIIKNRFQDAFKYWVSHAKKKINIFHVIDLNDSMRKSLQRHSFKSFLPKLRNSSEGIKKRVIDSMFKKMGLHKFLLRISLKKWKRIVARNLIIETQTKVLLLLKKGSKGLNLVKALSGCFLDWKRKTQIEIYLDNTRKEEQRKLRKIKATVQLNDLLRKIAQKNAFKKIKPQLEKFMVSKIKDQSVKKIIAQNPKLNRILLRNMLRIWKSINDSINQTKLRHKLFDKLFSKSSTRFSKNLLRLFLRKWERSKPKGTIVKISKGADMLKKHCRRNLIQVLKSSFFKKLEDQINKLKLKNSLKLLKIKDKVLSYFFKNSFEIWRNKILDFKNKDDRNLIWSKMLSQSARRILLRSLTKRFNIWRANKKEFKWEELKKILRGVDEASNFIKIKNCKKNFPHFISQLKNYKSNLFVKKFYQRLINYSNLNEILVRRKYLNLWKNKCKLIAIENLKQKIFKNVLKGRKIMSDKNILTRSLRNWKSKCEIDSSNQKMLRSFQIFNGGEKLNNLLKFKQNFFMNRIKKVLRKDPRSKIILALEKRLSKPRYSLSRAFDKWRRLNFLEKMLKKESDLINQLFLGKCNKLSKRIIRDSLKNKFIRWRLSLKKPDDYYEKICLGVKTLDSAIIKKYLNNPLTCVLNSKNYNKFVDIILPKQSLLRKRREFELLQDKFRLWFRFLLDNKKKDFALKIISKVKESQLKNLKSKLISKYWRKFVGFKKKSLHYPDVNKGANLLRNRLIRPFWSDIKKNITLYGDNRLKNKGIDTIFKNSRVFERKKFSRCFQRWFRNTLKDDSMLKNKTLRNLKRTIVDNYFSTPLQKYFRRWLISMIEKPVDLIKIREGLNSVNQTMTQNICRNPFKKLKNHICPTALQRMLFKNVIPKSKFFINKLKKDHLDFWRMKSSKLRENDLKIRTLSILYTRDKKKVIAYLLSHNFKRWKGKALKKPVDLTKIIEGEKIEFGVMLKKYLYPDFITNMKKYAYFRFLRSIFNGSSKYQLRAVKPFFEKWNDKSRKLKAKSLKNSLWARLIRNIRSQRVSTDIKDLMKGKILEWKLQAKKKTERISLNINDGIKKIIHKFRRDHFKLVTNKIKNEAENKSKLKKLNDIQPIFDNLLRIILRKKLTIWNKKLLKMKIQDFKIKSMEGNMKILTKKYLKNRLFLAFQRMKIPKKNQNIYTPLSVAIMTLRRLLNRRPWQKFVKSVEMMKLKCPFGMSLHEILFKKGKTYGKLMVLRNMKIRLIWNRWKKTIEDIQSKELNEKIVKKLLFRGHDKNKKTYLRNYLRKWKNQIQEEDQKNLREKTVSRFYKQMYLNNAKFFKRKILRIWKEINDVYMEKLNRITLSSTKLLAYYRRKYLRDLKNRVELVKEIERKKNLCKRIWRNCLMNLDRGKLFIMFAFWRKRVIDLKFLKVKNAFIRNLLNNSEKNSQIILKNRLLESFFKWRRLSTPRNIYDILKKIRLGEQNLVNTYKNKFKGQIFSGLKKLQTLSKIKERFINLMKKSDFSANLDKIRLRFLYWKVRAGDKYQARRLLNKLFINYSMEIKPKEFFIIPLNKLNEYLKRVSSSKSNNVIIIQNFFRGIFKSNQEKKVVDGTKKLKSSFHKSEKIKEKQGFNYLRLWKLNAQRMQIEAASLKIKAFLKSGRKNQLAKKENLTKFCNFITKSMRKNIFKKIKKRSNANRLKQIIIRCFKDIPLEVKLEFLRKAYLKWKEHSVIHRQNKAGFLLATITKGFLTRKYIRRQLKQKLRFNEIVKKLFGKHISMMRIFFTKWNLTSRVLKMSHAAKVIQDYISKKFNHVKSKEAKEKLKKRFNLALIRKLKEFIIRAAKFNKNSASVLHQTLKEIFYTRPFQKLRFFSFLIGRIKKISHVLPLLKEKFKLFWLPFYLNKWNNKVKQDSINRISFIQKTVKGKLLLWRIRTIQKKNKLMSKYFSKMVKDLSLKLKISLKIWKNNVKSIVVETATSQLQKIWVGKKSRENTLKLAFRVKMRNYLRKLFLRKLKEDFSSLYTYLIPMKIFLDEIESPFEQRYITNNLLEKNSNHIKYEIIKKLKENYESKLESMILKNSLKMWKNKLDKISQIVLKVQNNFRRYLSIKKLKKILKIKKQMLVQIIKYEQSIKTKKDILFKLWKALTQQELLIKSAMTIQNYLKKKNHNWKLSKIINFFEKLGEKIVNSRMNKTLKLYRLRKTLQEIFYKNLALHLKTLEKKRKVIWIFVKTFHAEDEKYRSLFIQKYYFEWKERTKQINDLRNKNSIMIQSNYRRYLLEKFLTKHKRKTNLILKIVENIVNSNELRMKIKLQLWKNINDSFKLKSSARVISSFIDEVKRKNNRKKNKRRLNEIKMGLENHLKIGILKFVSRISHEGLKNYFNINKINRLVTILSKKGQSYKVFALNRIEDNAFNIRKKCEVSTVKIQKRWKISVHQKKLAKFVNRLRNLRFMFKQALNKSTNQLTKAFNIWKKASILLLLRDSAKIIENFVDKNVSRKLKQGKIKSKEVLKKMLRLNFIKLKLNKFAKEFKFKKILVPGIKLLQKYAFKKLRYNIDNFEKLKLMWKLFRLPKSCVLKILRKNILLWNSKSEKLKNNQASNKITKNIRLHMARKRNKKIFDFVNQRLTELADKHANLVKYFMKRWSAITQKLKIDEAANTICGFVNHNWIKLKQKKKWKRLIDRLYDYNHLKEGLNLMVRYKKWKALNLLFGLSEQKLKIEGFKTFIWKGLILKKLKLVKSVFENFGDRENILFKSHYLDLWRTKVEKLENKENALINLEKILNTVLHINGAKALHQAFLCKKIMELFNKLKLFKAMRKIREKDKFVQKMMNLTKLLKNATNDLSNSNKPSICENLFKIYTFKVLRKMAETLENKTQKVFGKIILKSLENNLNNQIQYKNSCKNQGNYEVNENQFFTYSKCQSRNSKRVQAKNEKNHTFYLIPYFVNFLANKIKERKKISYDKIKNLSKNKKTLELINNAIGSFIKKPEKQFINRFKKLNDIKKLENQKINNLKSLFGRLTFKMLIKLAKGTGQQLRLIYLCRLSLMHHEISDKRFNSEIIRRWKYETHLNIVKKKKMEMINKIMNIQYLQMINGVFGDDEENPGLTKEVTQLNEKLGLYKNDNYLKNLKKGFVLGEKKIYDFKKNPKSEIDGFEVNSPQNRSLNKSVKSVSGKSNYEFVDDSNSSYIIGREDKSYSPKKYEKNKYY